MSYLLQTDNTSKIILQSGTGFLLLFIDSGTTTTTGGRQVSWDEIAKVERESARFLRNYNAPVPNFRTPFHSVAASRLGRYGGIASGISRRK